MTSTKTGSGSADRIIESLRDTGNAALESVRKFHDTVNGAFPDVGADNGPRQRIIDSAFKMTEQLVGTSTQLAEKIVKASQDALGEERSEAKRAPTKKAAKRAPAKKAAKRAPTKKAAKRAG